MNPSNGGTVGLIGYLAHCGILLGVEVAPLVKSENLSRRLTQVSTVLVHHGEPRTSPGQEIGDSPRAVGWRNARFVFVADGRFDRRIEDVEGLCPVVTAPFAPLATSSTGGGAALTSG